MRRGRAWRGDKSSGPGDTAAGAPGAASSVGAGVVVAVVVVVQALLAVWGTGAQGGELAVPGVVRWRWR